MLCCVPSYWAFIENIARLYWNSTNCEIKAQQRQYVWINNIVRPLPFCAAHASRPFAIIALYILITDLIVLCRTLRCLCVIYIKIDCLLLFIHICVRWKLYAVDILCACIFFSLKFYLSSVTIQLTKMMMTITTWCAHFHSKRSLFNSFYEVIDWKLCQSKNNQSKYEINRNQFSSFQTVCLQFKHIN